MNSTDAGVMQEATRGPEAVVGGHPPLVVKGGLDVNAASAADLAQRVPGVGATLAKAIVQNREIEGAFLTPYDLARVPGVGPKAFFQITGLTWREDVHARREKVMEVLAPDASGDVRLHDVASRFASLEGFAGCLIVDTDGDVLASCLRENASADALGAFAPHLLKRVESCVRMIDSGQVELLTLFIAERPYTLIPYENLVFVAVHEPNKFSRRQIRVAQQVVGTLGRLLFRDRAPVT